MSLNTLLLFYTLDEVEEIRADRLLVLHISNLVLPPSAPCWSCWSCVRLLRLPEQSATDREAGTTEFILPSSGGQRFKIKVSAGGAS